MNETIFHIKQELKRADHLYYVSLKYTRTVDVIRSIIDRLISAFDFMIDGVLHKLKEEGKISEIPSVPGLKCDILRKTFPEKEKVLEYVEFYLLLRKIMRSQYSASGEFRKNVAMTLKMLNPETNMEQEFVVNVEKVKEYYDRTKECLAYVEEFMGEYLE